MEKLSPLSDPLLYGSIVKTPEGKKFIHGCPYVYYCKVDNIIRFINLSV